MEQDARNELNQRIILVLSQFHEVTLLALGSLFVTRLRHGNELLGVRLLGYHFDQVALLAILDKSRVVLRYVVSDLTQHLVDDFEANFYVFDAVSAQNTALIVEHMGEMFSILYVLLSFDHFQESQLVAAFDQRAVLLREYRSRKDKVVGQFGSRSLENVPLHILLPLPESFEGKELPEERNLVVHHLVDSLRDVLLFGDHFGRAVLIRRDGDKSALREHNLPSMDFLQVLGVTETDTTF